MNFWFLYFNRSLSSYFKQPNSQTLNQSSRSALLQRNKKRNNICQQLLTIDRNAECFECRYTLVVKIALMEEPLLDRLRSSMSDQMVNGLQVGKNCSNHSTKTRKTIVAITRIRVQDSFRMHKEGLANGHKQTDYSSNTTSVSFHSGPNYL